MSVWEGSVQRVRWWRQPAERWWSLTTQALKQHMIFEISLITTLAVRWWVLWAVVPKSVLSLAEGLLHSVCLTYSWPLNKMSLHWMGLLTRRFVFCFCFFINKYLYCFLSVDGVCGCRGLAVALTYTIVPGEREHSRSLVSVGGPGASPPQIQLV